MPFKPDLPSLLHNGLCSSDLDMHTLQMLLFGVALKRMAL